ncbi:glycosyltransferase family 4 protein [Pedobacter miscanthi]|uniref:Glycosyl transferase family 1 domain-containing protein n=1 Tax=Pedobacter miscanthi TaxID=2259170 RepID=A0A366L951_9SPHI|nr:glycosyltransferase family 4 protein [Pedobacter miscanthi]RBQ09999.1 hypothetical protein DRW42_06060 [Pedobacter miscanthi]
MIKKAETTSIINAVVHASPGIGKFSTETIKAYNQENYLKFMCTTVAFHPANSYVNLLLKIFPFIKKRLKNRFFTDVPDHKIKLYPWKEVCRLLAVRFLSLKSADIIWEWAELNFDKWVARKLNHSVKIVHCYEHAALSTFERAQQINCFKILEQTSQHYSFYEALLNEQFKQYPLLKSEYNEHISGKLFSKRNKRKQKECELADLIICNSTFTLKTLINAGVDENKILKIPLAYPVISDTHSKNEEKKQFIFICIGSLSIRKGTHILLEVWRKYFADCADARLILAGSNSLPKEFTENLPLNIEFKGFLGKSDLNELYENADLLVFPTLADGFGMVITEAMANGLTVLTTNNSAGYDLIDNDVDGFLVEAGNADQLAKKMLWIKQNKTILPEMSRLILEKAKKYQWSDYRALLIKSISERYQNHLNP